MLDSSRARLDGRTAVVTGAGAGIGRGIALGFAAFGASVVVLERVPETGTATADAIVASGGRALAVPTDVRDAAALDRAIAAAVAAFGGIDILVNNVGGTFHAPFLEVSAKGRDALVATNLTSVFLGTATVTPHMIAGGRGGSIVNVVSSEGFRAAPGFAVYAACKAAVISFTKTMALELAAHAIRVNAIAPDICRTEGLDAMVTEVERERHEHLVPIGRAGIPDDIAGVALFLASDLGSYVTGVTIPVDGGTNAAGGWYRDPTTGSWTLGPPRRGA
jgi:3-oxoacyl-[acyl-carrier protein] reductase